MFERFTERARQVVVLAQDEARVLRHDYIGTEHLLLGLVREERGFAARVLESFGADAELMREYVISTLGGAAVPDPAPERRELRLGDIDEWAEWAEPRVRRELGDRTALLLAIVLAVTSFPFGLLVGWLIWG